MVQNGDKGGREGGVKNPGNLADVPYVKPLNGEVRFAERRRSLAVVQAAYSLHKAFVIVWVQNESRGKNKIKKALLFAINRAGSTK